MPKTKLNQASFDASRAKVIDYIESQRNAPSIGAAGPYVTAGVAAAKTGLAVTTCITHLNLLAMEGFLEKKIVKRTRVAYKIVGGYGEEAGKEVKTD